MGSLEKRLEALEGRVPASGDTERRERSEARERMRASLDEIAAARREGRERSPWAESIAQAIERRRELRYGA